MKRVLLVIVLLLVTLLLWGLLTSGSNILPFLVPSPSPEQTSATTNPQQLTPSVSPSPSEAPSPTITVSPSPTPFIYPPPSPGDPFEVRYHPDGGLYVGDLISLEVIAPPEFLNDAAEVIVEIGSTEQVVLGPVEFAPFGIAGRPQATLMWAWDTSGLQPGEYTLTYTITPQEFTWDETISLLPQSQYPAPEPDADWAYFHSECCTFHYISATAAEWDLERLVDIADQQARLVAAHFDVDFSAPIPITLMPRVLGHGGFAGREIYISYLERNYAGDSFPMVVHHEMVHILDARLGGDYRPTLFVEGLAVYLTGGHFKPEPLMPRAATLLDQGIYIPLTELADNFYPSQHEIGYLQAGALVEFMVITWGWDGFSDFYRGIPAPENSSPSQSIDLALQENFGISFAHLEELFVAELSRMQLNPEMVSDVRLTIDYYDTVRRYQQALDPSAYFMTAWLPNIEEMRQEGILADLLRKPSNPENIALEAIFVQADKHLRTGNYSQVDVHLRAINAVLDAMDEFDLYPFARHSLAADHYAITLALLDEGYELISAEIENENARVQAGTPGDKSVSLQLVKVASQWQVQPVFSGVELGNYRFPVRDFLFVPFPMAALALTTR
ncbi:MAG: hypothetical protein IBX69_12960 [Anaerolineales bacterium]|nr:hypothetical protein [Anaerolineales bacterium]